MEWLLTTIFTYFSIVPIDLLAPRESVSSTDGTSANRYGPLSAWFRGPAS